MGQLVKTRAHFLPKKLIVEKKHHYKTYTFLTKLEISNEYQFILCEATIK